MNYLMKPVEDEKAKNSLTLDLITNMSGVIGEAIIGDPTGIAAAVLPRIINEVIHRIIFPLTSPSESKRLYQWGKQAAEGIAQRVIAGEEFRKDGVFKETPTNRSNFEEVVESTLKMVIDATEEPKVKFMRYLTENFHFDEDLDINTYRQILKALEELSYRQFCIIRLISLGDQNVYIDPIDGREQVPPNEQTRFYSIGRDFESLMDNRYITAASIPRYSDIGDPHLRSPGFGSLQGSAKRLDRFVNLDQIPDEDIEKAFSLWNVRVKKGESES